MEERELRSAKMYYEHKVDIEKFKKETFEKLERNNYQHKKRTIISKNRLILATVFTLIIIPTIGFTVGGSQFTKAAESLISQMFGQTDIKIIFPNASVNEINMLEEHLQVAKRILSDKEFSTYSELIKENREIHKSDDYLSDNEKIMRVDEISSQIKKYEQKILAKSVDFPIFKPTYIPEGYVYKETTIRPKTGFFRKDPSVELEYQKGEFGFWATQAKTGQEDGFALWEFQYTDSYTLKGYTLEYRHSEDSNIQGIKVNVPKEGIEIFILADRLSKEEMEKILLSMVEKK
ncbi:hypothetical protein SAMN05444673_4102 [Bacillus sp. OV166]|uniref:hypothetical protein n=1 Tax=Bacillus sp. OV166 TaxID=1882763 RepID=UPI000A2AED7C|nr:hypothetical protein [Bacillus sp. OV166]SMQ81036.1 hypothetical protein SAMN05444673_4102 [Bacillus sp. OV166]